MTKSGAPPTSVRTKAIRFWAVLTVIDFILLGLCHTYDQLWGNSDRLILGVAYQNTVIALIWLNIIGIIFSIGLTSRQKIVQNISLSLLSSLVCLLLLEGIGHLILGLNLVYGPPFIFHRFHIPAGVSITRPFPAGDLHPIAGRCHLSYGSDTFTNCEGDTVRWTYNSAGANDRQRQLINPNPEKKRIAIVGDSFLEGYMVSTTDRCSSVLERKTGLEHLNFAVNGSTPVQYYLMYKAVAKSFDPDVLIVGFLPANDFEILDERNAYNYVEYPQYIPYWQGTYPHYRLRYSLANVTQSIFHGTTTQASLLNVVDSVYATLPLVDKLKADFLPHSSLLRLFNEWNGRSYRDGQCTRYQQFKEEEWQYVKYSLTKLVEEARGKNVLILSIPTLSDLMALKKNTPNRIDPLLADFCRQQGINFIPLAASFLAYKGDLNRLYVACDGHWSVEGEAFAANALLNHPVYCSVVGSHKVAAN